MEAKLVVVGGEVKTGEVKIKKLPSVVGRGDDADIRLRHPLVSRRHCEIFESGGLLKVRDLGSLNGTFIASNKIKESVLKPDELITIGPVVFRAVYEGPANAAAGAGDDIDFDLSDDFEVHETQPVDIKKTAAIRETVSFDSKDAPTGTVQDDDFDLTDFDLGDEEEKPAKPAKTSAPAKPAAKAPAKAEEPTDDFDLDFDFEVDEEKPAAKDSATKGADAGAKPKTPAKADDDIEIDIDDLSSTDDDFADLLSIEIDDEPAPAKPAAGKKAEPDKGKPKEPAKPAAKAAADELDADEFDIDIDGIGDDDEMDDFLKDIGMDK